MLYDIFLWFFLLTGNLSASTTELGPETETTTHAAYGRPTRVRIPGPWFGVSRKK